MFSAVVGGFAPRFLSVSYGRAYAAETAWPQLSHGVTPCAAHMISLIRAPIAPSLPRWMGGTRFVVGALQQILLKRKHAARVALLEPAADGAGSGSAAAAAAGAAAAASAAAADGQQVGVQPPTAAQQHAEALAAAAAQPGPPVQQLAAFQQLAGELGGRGCAIFPSCLSAAVLQRLTTL